MEGSKFISKVKCLLDFSKGDWMKQINPLSTLKGNKKKNLQLKQSSQALVPLKRQWLQMYNPNIIKNDFPKFNKLKPYLLFREEALVTNKFTLRNAHKFASIVNYSCKLLRYKQYNSTPYPLIEVCNRIAPKSTNASSCISSRGFCHNRNSGRSVKPSKTCMSNARNFGCRFYHKSLGCHRPVKALLARCSSSCSNDSGKNSHRDSESRNRRELPAAKRLPLSVRKLSERSGNSKAVETKEATCNSKTVETKEATCNSKTVETKEATCNSKTVETKEATCNSKTVETKEATCLSKESSAPKSTEFPVVKSHGCTKRDHPKKDNVCKQRIKDCIVQHLECVSRKDVCEIIKENDKANADLCKELIIKNIDRHLDMQNWETTCKTVVCPEGKAERIGGEGQKKPETADSKNISVPAEVNVAAKVKPEPTCKAPKSTIQTPPKEPVAKSTIQTPPKEPVAKSTIQTPPKEPVAKSTIQTPPKEPFAKSTIQTPQKEPVAKSTLQKPLKEPVDIKIAKTPYQKESVKALKSKRSERKVESVIESKISKMAKEIKILMNLEGRFKETAGGHQKKALHYTQMLKKLPLNFMNRILDRLHTKTGKKQSKPFSAQKQKFEAKKSVPRDQKVDCKHLQERPQKKTEGALPRSAETQSDKKEPSKDASGKSKSGEHRTDKKTDIPPLCSHGTQSENTNKIEPPKESTTNKPALEQSKPGQHTAKSSSISCDSGAENISFSYPCNPNIEKPDISCTKIRRRAQLKQGITSQSSKSGAQTDTSNTCSPNNKKTSVPKPCTEPSKSGCSADTKSCATNENKTTRPESSQCKADRKKCSIFLYDKQDTDRSSSAKCSEADTTKTFAKEEPPCNSKSSSHVCAKSICSKQMAVCEKSPPLDTDDTKCTSVCGDIKPKCNDTCESYNPYESISFICEKSVSNKSPKPSSETKQTCRICFKETLNKTPCSDKPVRIPEKVTKQPSSCVSKDEVQKSEQDCSSSKRHSEDSEAHSKEKKRKVVSCQKEENCPCLSESEDHAHSGADTTYGIPSFIFQEKPSVSEEVSKDGTYKNPEYFSYHKTSFHDIMKLMENKYQPQPSAKKARPVKKITNKGDSGCP